MRRPRSVRCSLRPLGVLLLLWSGGCDNEARTDPAIDVVAASLGTNKLGIEAPALRSRPNPKGDGTFVYVPQTRFEGVERQVVWLVIDNKAYPLNGATKGTVTPLLPWPREAPAAVWQRTGLNQYSAAEATEIVFGSE